jgi:hypothetical protein
MSRCYPRELDRFEITHVPAELRERDRLITGRNRRDLAPVLKRYERVCFTKEAVRPVDRPGLAFASLIHPGHPLIRINGRDLVCKPNIYAYTGSGASIHQLGHLG